jgi:outer membrane protein
LPPIPDEEAPAAQLLKVAAEQRPELRVLALQSNAQHLTARAAKGQYGPSITANAQFYEAGTDLSKLTWNWYAGASFNWPFYQGGLSRANLRQARANVASLAAQLELLRQQVLLQLEQGRAAVSAARATLVATQEVLDNAQARYGLADGRYEAGVGNIIELEDAQIALANAQFQYIQAEYNLAIARAQLLNGLGRPD